MPVSDSPVSKRGPFLRPLRAPLAPFAALAGRPALASEAGAAAASAPSAAGVPASALAGARSAAFFRGARTFFSADGAGLPADSAVAVAFAGASFFAGARFAAGSLRTRFAGAALAAPARPRDEAGRVAFVAFAALVAFFAGVRAVFDGRFVVAFFAVFAAPRRAGARPVVLLRDVFPAAFLAVALPAGRRAVPPVAFFAGDFRPVDFFADGRFAVFFTGALRADVFLPAAFLAGAFFAGALRVVFLAPPFAAFFAVVLPLPAADRLAVFVVAFFTLFFPTDFFVVFLALRPVPAFRADFRAPPADFFPATLRFAAALRVTVFFAPAFFAPAFFPPAFFAPAFFAPAFFAAGLRAAAFRAAGFAFAARAFFAAGARTVATRTRCDSVMSDCSACPAFDLACEAMLTSRNAGLGSCPAGFADQPR